MSCTRFRKNECNNQYQDIVFIQVMRAVKQRTQGWEPDGSKDTNTNLGTQKMYIKNYKYIKVFVISIIRSYISDDL